jgi:hypothetical protein
MAADQELVTVMESLLRTAIPGPSELSSLGR